MAGRSVPGSAGHVGHLGMWPPLGPMEKSQCWPRMRRNAATAESSLCGETLARLSRSKSMGTHAHGVHAKGDTTRCGYVVKSGVFTAQ